MNDQIETQEKIRIIVREKGRFRSRNLFITVRKVMRNQPLIIQFIMPEHASLMARATYRHLRKQLSQNHTIQLQLTPSKGEKGEFFAQVSFKELEMVQTTNELKDADLASESDIRNAIHEFQSNPLASNMKPSQCIYAIMSILKKPVILQCFCRLCYETLSLCPETIRGTLNKKRTLYISPKHGVWCTLEVGNHLGLQDCR